MDTSQLLSVRQVADELGVTPPRVRQLIYAGRLKAQKVGPILVIRAEDFEAFRGIPRRSGRPRIKELDYDTGGRSDGG